MSTPHADLTAGLCAGAAYVLAGFPFDTLKVRLQADRGVYRGAWHCLVHILKYEGVSTAVMPVSKTSNWLMPDQTWTVSWFESTPHWRHTRDWYQLLRKHPALHLVGTVTGLRFSTEH